MCSNRHGKRLAKQRKNQPELTLIELTDILPAPFERGDGFVKEISRNHIEFVNGQAGSLKGRVMPVGVIPETLREYPVTQPKRVNTTRVKTVTKIAKPVPRETKRKRKRKAVNVEFTTKRWKLIWFMIFGYLLSE